MENIENEKINYIGRSPEQLLKFALKREKDANKGTVGKVFVIGGSYNMTGAPVLCAEAALRTGAGLVYICVPDGIKSICQSMLSEAVFCPVGKMFSNEPFFKEEHVDYAFERAKTCDSVVIGPGMGREMQTVNFISSFLLKMCRYIKQQILDGKKPVKILIDADALYALSVCGQSKLGEIIKNSEPEYVVATPHAFEASRLINVDADYINKNKAAAGREMYEKYNFTSVIKGNMTNVVGIKGVYVNETGNCGMATAGSGDVLSGIIGTILTRMGGNDSAVAGVFLHGLVGDCLKEMFGISYFTSKDMVKYLYKALKQYEK